MAVVLVTGGTGLIGKSLCKLLQSKGHSVFILSRKKIANPSYFYWNINANYIDEKAITKANYIIHLAGEGIADKRWTKSRKKVLLNSRVNSANLLFDKVKKLNPKLKGFIAASGIGYYGATTSTKIYTEQDTFGNDFISTICKLWEKATFQFNSLNIRTVIFRTGVVLSKNGGAYPKISNPIKLGLGMAFGNGKQYMPWIHIEDICNMYANAIENNNIQGVYNATAPEHITNKTFCKTIATILKKLFWLPNMPSFILKLILGKMGVILLEGSRISGSKIIATGFTFKFPKVKDALNNLIN